MTERQPRNTGVRSPKLLFGGFFVFILMVTALPLLLLETTSRIMRANDCPIGKGVKGPCEAFGIEWGGTFNELGNLALLATAILTPAGLLALFVWLIAWISFTSAKADEQATLTRTAGAIV